MNTPVESPVQDTTVEQNVQTTPEQTSGENVNEGVGPETQAKDVHQNNWNNGKRRIQQRSAKERIKQLEARIAELEGKDDDYSRFQREQLQDRVDDMSAMTADAEANEFADRAAEWFGDETEQFMQDTYRYAAYVNQHEPDLLKFSQREYGPILLHEWYKRMDQPALRQQWLGMTAYEKGQVLTNLYQQIAAVIAQASQKRSAPAPAQNVPVPNGGRQSAGPISDGSDFGIELGKSFNRHNMR